MDISYTEVCVEEAKAGLSKSMGEAYVLLNDDDNLFSTPADNAKRVEEIENLSGVTRIDQPDKSLALFHIPNLSRRLHELFPSCHPEIRRTLD